MPTSLTRSWVRLLSGTLLVILLTLPFFIPEIVSTYWHLRFGDSTTFHEWKVPVPKGWFAFTREDLLVLQKATRFFETEDAPTISFALLPPGGPVDPRVLKEITISTNSKKGYAFQEDKPIEAGNNPGYCLSFRGAEGKNTVRISCYLSAGHLFVDLFSGPSETQTLYTVVEHISPAAGSGDKPVAN